MASERDPRDSFFTPEQLRTFLALADCVVPADEFPSASESGTLTFFTRLFEHDLADRRLELLDGLNRVAATALGTHSLGFADLSPDAQAAQLRAVESGDDVELKAFFTWFTAMVLEGYYADPANGGNDKAASWKMVGYDPRVPGLNWVES